MPVLMVATADGVHVVGEIPGGGRQRTELEGHSVRALLRDGGAWVALVDGHSVWRRSAEGAWAEWVVGHDELTCLALAPGGALLGTAGAHLRRLSPTGVIEEVASFEHAPTREQWYTPSGGLPEVRSLAVAGDGTLFANVHVGGILRSTDGGFSWAATIDLHADVHQVLCPRQYQPALVVAACADGLAISRDGGDSWRLRDAGLRRTYCRAVAVAGDTVLVSASDGPGGGHAGVYRAPMDGWAPFELCRDGLPPELAGNVDTGWLATAAPGGVGAALVIAGGDVFATSGEGAAWSPVAGGLTRPNWLTWA